jgi:hypothetical protein
LSPTKPHDPVHGWTRGRNAAAQRRPALVCCPACPATRVLHASFSSTAHAYSSVRASDRIHPASRGNTDSRRPT